MTGSVFIPGQPVPQGSTKGFPVHRADGRTGVRITHSNKDTLLPWRNSVTAHVRAEIGPTILYPRPEGVGLSMTFVMPRRARENKNLPPHTRQPDLDKLVRAVLDGLTGCLFEDDSQVIGFSGVTKRTADPEEVPGLYLSWCNHDEYVQLWTFIHNAARQAEAATR